MKGKIGGLILGVITSIVAIFGMQITVDAADVPVYDLTFNNNQGAFYANGTPIVIDENSSGETVVLWDGGSQIVPATVSVFGGGKEDTNYETSNIVMNNGKVAFIYGGGISLITGKTADVNEANVVVNGGTISETLYGGGVIYAKVDEANVTLNGGNIKFISGGGSAAKTISGVTYAAGTEEKPQDSLNRVEVANVVINDGKVTEATYGGGQGYSYVGISNLTVNGGKTLVVSGGSNGYTGIANTKITGGNISSIQTVNRGIVESAIVNITGGDIAEAYVAGKNDSDVTGKVLKVEFNVLGGNINELSKGISDKKEIIVDQDVYKVIYVKESVKKSNIGESEVVIDYSFDIIEDSIDLLIGFERKVTLDLNTIPKGYEYLFENEIVNLVSEDINIASVDDDGWILGINEGTTIVTGSLLNKSDSVEVNVISGIPFMIMGILFGILAIVAIAIIVLGLLISIII